ncbi:MAG TPA: HNH endonuclease [Polyangiales bacterium]|nr:HNH endonuclease [Polyangiales bacterium]
MGNPVTYEVGQAVEARVSATGAINSLRKWRRGTVVSVGETTMTVLIGQRTHWTVMRKDVRRARDTDGKAPARGPKADRGPLRSEAYKAFVRGKPCMFCPAMPPVDPHHFGPRGTGQKTDDLRCVPACWRCHERFHDGKWEALGFVDRVTTVAAIYRKQVDLLIEYFGGRTAAA